MKFTHKMPPRRPQTLQKAHKTAQETSKRPTRRPQDASKADQDVPKTPPRRFKDGSKMVPRRLQNSFASQDVQRRSQDAPRRSQDVPRGREEVPKEGPRRPEVTPQKPKRSKTFAIHLPLAYEEKRKTLTSNQRLLKNHHKQLSFRNASVPETEKGKQNIETSKPRA